MILDTSALIAILQAEPEAAACAGAVEAAPRRRMLAANFVEAAVVIDGSRDPVASRRRQLRPIWARMVSNMM